MNDEPQSEVDRLFEKVYAWPAIIDHSMISVQALKSDPDDEDPMYAVVSHNPFNLRQYQVLAVLPSLDMQISITAKLEANVETFASRVLGDEDLAPIIEHMKVGRLKHAAHTDKEFAHKAVDARFDDLDLEAAGRLYQAHYGLTNGGDFNRPLY